jgi:hypothetical protein
MASAIDLGKTSESKSSDAMTVKGGGKSSTGPTGSSTSYPKNGSKPGNTDNAPFNPYKDPKSGSSIYVGGVD